MGNFLLQFLLACYFCFVAADEEMKIVSDCPYFDINKQITLLEQPTQYDRQTKIFDAYIKRFIDREDLFDTILNILPKNEVERLHKYRERAIKVFQTSAVWVPEKTLFLASVRVWVFDYICYLYTTFFDENWKQVKDVTWIGQTKVPSLLNIANDWSIANSGPEDGRIFRALSDQFFIVFNMKRKDPPARPLYLYSFTSGKYRELRIPEHSKNSVLIEKNWAPLIIDDSHIYFVYNFENFQIIDCTDENLCNRVQGSYKREAGVLRGGTSYNKYKNTDYYFSISFTHFEYTKSGWCKLYRPALSLLKSNGYDFNLIYTSEPIDFNSRIILKPMTNLKSASEKEFCSTGGWLIPNSIARVQESTDIADITFSLDDDVQLVAKVKGLLKFVEKVIDFYEKRRLPRENKCAEKLANRYYNREDLVSPLKGLEEQEFEKNTKRDNEANKGPCKTSQYFDKESNRCESKVYLECFDTCEECEIYDYCTKCRDENSVMKGGYCFCKDGFYRDSNSNSCKPCSQDCLICASPYDCLKCKLANSVVDSGFCRCLEGFLEVFNAQTKSYSCEDATNIATQSNFCYQSHTEINKDDYTYIFNSNFGYSISPDKNSLSVFLSSISSDEIDTDKETKYCEFGLSKGKPEKLVTSFVQDGYIIELEVKVTKV